MGTSGDRKGYKVFSINTTIRNPVRNYDFLKVFEKYNGMENTKNNLYLYYFDLIKNGIYKSINVPSNIKFKWENDYELTVSEVKDIIDNNPQATGISGRVMTQIRALKDQGLIKLDEISNKKCIIKISSLGNELLKNPNKAQTIYTKIMLSMHAHNPCRNTMLNKSIPFLNTIFVINEVNNKWKDLGNEPKGILLYEFGAFVLSMKDCDYKTTAQEIINYRLKYKYDCNKQYIENYLSNKNILKMNFNSIIKDYPDEVFRKFEMTGLLTRHGMYSHIYINFSKYNIEKINTILQYYKDYSFIEFNSKDEYYNYQKDIIIPWEQDDLIRRKIIEAKASVLKIKIDSKIPLEENEKFLDSLFYNSALQKAVNKIELNTIIKELLILSGTIKEKSKFDSLPEPLRLEYMLALLLGKKFGTKGLVSNIIYNEDGMPLHCAVGGKCDISYHDINGAYILEPTMQRGKEQQLNSETTNIVRHAKDEENKYNIKHRVMMIAPRIHPDVVDFFVYKINRDDVRILSVTIDKTLSLLVDSNNISNLNLNYDSELNKMIVMGNISYADYNNQFKYNLN